MQMSPLIDMLDISDAKRITRNYAHALRYGSMFHHRRCGIGRSFMTAGMFSVFLIHSPIWIRLLQTLRCMAVCASTCDDDPTMELKGEPLAASPAQRL